MSRHPFRGCASPFIGVGGLMLFLASTAAGQALGTNAHAYVQVGINVGSTTAVRGHGEAAGNARLGFRGGAGVDLQKGAATSFLLLLSYDQRRSQHRYREDWYEPNVGQVLPGEWNQEVAIAYVIAAIHTRFSPVRTVPFFIGGGPEVGFPVSATEKLTWQSAESLWHFERGMVSNVGSPEFALLAEAGVTLTVGSLLCVPTVSYTIGLTSIGGDDGRVGRVQRGLGDAKHRVLGLSLGIRGR